ncbi:hypothetical protein CHELA1G11_14408 [Hyphomicrobiales bacterium]|nr:hypothetical protein CHELA1G11_14408 [Hyphomicrobiales bacterium]CAH1680394.1 hypothetical protein CHELA1G2_14696 [Hyphomicrobiales bacterium]
MSSFPEWHLTDRATVSYIQPKGKRSCGFFCDKQAALVLSARLLCLICSRFPPPPSLLPPYLLLYT